MEFGKGGNDFLIPSGRVDRFLDCIGQRIFLKNLCQPFFQGWIVGREALLGERLYCSPARVRNKRRKKYMLLIEQSITR